MSCRDIHTYLHDYIEGTLPPGKRQLVETHLKECTDCRGEIPEMKNTVILARELEEIDPPPFLKTRIMADVHEESRRQSKLMRFFMAPLRLPAGALVILTIFLTSGYLYYVFGPAGEKSDAPQISRTVPSHMPDNRSSSDQPPEALVRQPPEDLTVYDRQPGGNINIDQLRAIMDGRMVDVDVSVAVEDVPVSAKIILKDLLQMDGNIFKAELLEKEYLISAGIKSARKADLLAKLKMVGEVDLAGDRQAAEKILRIQIRVVENQ